jgi:hypothetical protein
MSKSLLITVAVAAVVAFIAGFFFLVGSSTAQDMDLEGASAEELADLGVVFERPKDGDLPVVTRQPQPPLPRPDSIPAPKLARSSLPGCMVEAAMSGMDNWSGL